MMIRDSCQKVNAVSGKVQNIQRNSIKGKCRVFVSLPDRFQNKLYKDTMKEELCQGNKAESPSEELNCNMKCEKINELSFHTSFFYEKNQ